MTKNLLLFKATCIETTYYQLTVQSYRKLVKRYTRRKVESPEEIGGKKVGAVWLAGALRRVFLDLGNGREGSPCSNSTQKVISPLGERSGLLCLLRQL